jgi:hypothetical protein
MLSFLNDKFKNDGKKRFLSLAAFFIFISDLINIVYLNLYWFEKKITIPFLVKAASFQGVNLMTHPRQDLIAYRQLLIATLANVFIAFIVYHAFVYFRFSKDKQWAIKYVYGYALTGAILTLIELPSVFSDHKLWGLAMIVTTAIYTYCFLGIRYFKKSNLGK